ncbi:prolipoprotein diacylglyceryl transferase [Candidatus Venteria ishoeyi]|uniref:Phosphatidylglycerol--prolipoprotein diacylglyceryl transferase n=1 Tax=Candidatus Venteria ishoeyi TaxID=1899563 RepID=A0A1H6F279_9GAMM|nr:prolipoprotein diacylglyceryl transferase [Candidatus Venteria ishoeyi]MDM8547017.1 prolipoprotein diacylglyceryl transferase [Candidatus Venteria ishoeyi]SEH04258.1 Prolipoprotein diacylglyceryl transferase [Candidatus Venteria ishoeyi]
MLNYPQINPIMLELGPLQIHWYGMMYLLAFSLGWGLAMHRARQPWTPYHAEQIGDLVFYVAIGAVLGGRLGYILFYNFSVYLQSPLDIFKIWQGGMSFHGGLLGVIAVLAWYAKNQQRGFFETTDFIAPMVPLGLGLGRIGNFINGELWGAPTSAPWGMVFRHVDSLPRHPSQLYEFVLEGLVLFVIVWLFSRKPRPVMSVSALFLISYGAFRFIIEFFREPDEHLGYLAFDWLTMGHVLTLPMLILGLALMYLAYRNPRLPQATASLDVKG